MEALESQTKYEIEDVGPCKKKISFEIPVELLKGEYESNMKELIAHANIKGFRKGKAPRAMLERKYKNDILQEVKMTVLQNAFREVVDEKELKPITDPDVDVEQIEVDVEKPLEFHLEIEVEPTFELGDYKGIEVEVETEEVNDETIDKALKQMQKHHGSLKEKENQKVEEGDEVEMSFSFRYEDHVLQEESEYRYSWEQKRVYGVEVEDFEKELEGMSAGDEKTVSVVLPEFMMKQKEELSETLEDLKSKLGDEETLKIPGKLEFKLNKVFVMEYPEITDEFVQEHENMSLAEFRDKLKEELEKQKENAVTQKASKAALEKLMESYDFDVPEGIIERHLNRQFQNSREFSEFLSQNQELVQDSDTEAVREKVKEVFETYKNENMEKAKSEFRERLVLEKIAKKERIYVTEQEVEYRIQMLAQLQQIPGDRLMSMLEERGQLENIRTDMKAEKTMEFLGKQAKVNEVVKSEEKEDKS